MKMHKHFRFCLIILAVQLALVLWLGSKLPPDARLPVHWNLRSEIDGWASKNVAMLPFWLFNLGLFLLLMFSGWLSPVFRQNRERYDAVIPLLTLGLVFFFALFHVYILLLGLYPQWQNKVQAVFVLMGLLFVFLGNLLPRIPRNYIAGIKTPWTIYSDEIWRRTARLGGYCFVFAGLAMVLRGILNLTAPWVNAAMLIVLLGLVLIPAVYSFWLFRFGGIDKE